MDNGSLAEFQYQEFMLSSLSLLREAREEHLTESEIMTRTQQVNEKYLTFLITLVLENQHEGHNLPDEILNSITSGELNYDNVSEYAPLEPLFQFDLEAIKNAIQTN